MLPGWARTDLRENSILETRINSSRFNLSFIIILKEETKYFNCFPLKSQILVYFYDKDLLIDYAKKLKKPKISGETHEKKRKECFDRFRSDPSYPVIFISSVGDTSIDLPDANVVIEISGQFGGRRQFTQRFGRILRPKPNKKDRFNAFFYCIVSLGTEVLFDFSY